MKSNAIARIVLNAILILLLVAILISALGIELFSINSDSYQSANEGSVDAAIVKELSIDWAAGSITILANDTDKITFSEAGDFNSKYDMVYSIEGGKLSIEYAKDSVTVGFGAIPKKDLTITVPRSWQCEELELDAAAVELSIEGLSVGNLELDCAAGEVRFNGSVDTIDCDGAAMELSITCANKPSKINIDGAACELAVKLPAGCGYAAHITSLGGEFNSNVAFTKNDSSYKYGDESCKLFIDGLGSEVNIQIAE